jgi:hypothetical protein
MGIAYHSTLETVGINTLEDLNRQREQIIRTRDTVTL